MMPFHKRLNMRPEVESLICKGVLPSSMGTVGEITEWQEVVQRIEPPLSDEEAIALSALFPAGQDDCFGLVWSLIHLVETAPHWPLEECLQDRNNPWVLHLRRAARLD